MLTMGFVEDFTDGLQSLVGDGRRFKNPNQLSEYLGQPPTQTSRYLKGERTAYLSAIGAMLDKLGFRLMRPGAVVDESGSPPEVTKEEDFRKRVALDVARACIELSLDSSVMAKILAAANGKDTEEGHATACSWPAAGRKAN